MQGQNHHHSQKPQNQQCTQQSQHCSHFQSHYQFTLSQIIIQAATVQQLTSTELCLRIVWLSDGPAPPSMELCVVSMELWARHMGRHCVVDKIVTFWGAEFPFFSGKNYGNKFYSQSLHSKVPSASLSMNSGQAYIRPTPTL